MYRKLDESKLKKYWYELRGSELYGENTLKL